MAQRLKHLPAMQENWVRSLGREDPLEKEMATHSSILAWRISWTEEPGGLQSMGSQRVRHISHEQPCLKTTGLYEDILLLSKLFHFCYFIFSVPILAFNCNGLLAFVRLLIVKTDKHHSL